MRVSAIFIFISTLIASNAAALSQENIASIEREIRRDLAAIQTLTRKWPSVQKQYNTSVATYRASERTVSSCKRGIWQYVFKDTFKDLESARKGLEQARKAIDTANSKANNALKTQDRKRRLLEATFNGRERGPVYLSQLNDIVGTINSDYRMIVADVVIPGYRDYVKGINGLSESYRNAAKDCNRPLPFTAVKVLFNDVIKIITGKISLANHLSKIILERIPESFK